MSEMNQDRKQAPSGLPSGEATGLPGSKKAAAPSGKSNKNAKLDSEAGNVKNKDASQYSKTDDNVLQGGGSAGKGSGA